MKHYSSEAQHLRGVQFEISYPASPYHACTPIFATLSGALNPDGRLPARRTPPRIAPVEAHDGLVRALRTTVRPAASPRARTRRSARQARPARPCRVLHVVGRPARRRGKGSTRGSSRSRIGRLLTE